MSVIFYPEKDENRLNELIIHDNGKPNYGEIDVYKLLLESLGNSKLEWHVWHDLNLPVHEDGFHEGIDVNPRHKSDGQIDFLILCEEGMVILEVKGSSIQFRGNKFYYNNGEECQDPFSQSNGYKATIKKSILREFKGFYTNAVAFPHVNHKFTTRIYDEKQLWTKYNAKSFFNDSIEQFLLQWIRHKKRTYKEKGHHFTGFSAKQIEQIISVLSPSIWDRNPLPPLNETYKWLEVDNMEILEGLHKNPRIMIEGPPGSGKTTFALAFADRFRRKKGLYLCWNNLLMHSIRARIKERGLNNNIEVTTLTGFIMSKGGYSANELNTLDSFGLCEAIRKTINKIMIGGNFKGYDYFILDEAQDYVDKGVDMLIDRLYSFEGKGMEDGNMLILYDVDQSYSWRGRDITDDIDFFASFCAHYSLSDIKRSAQEAGIIKLSHDVLFNSELSSSSPNIIIKEYDSLKEVKKEIRKKYIHGIRDKQSSLLGKDCVVLGESKFYKDAADTELYFPEELEVVGMEELDSKNVNSTKNVLRHTSILKYKGLEANNVFILTSPLNDYNQYELYVGITRAMKNLHIFIINE